jgi:hypothetical protein
MNATQEFPISESMTCAPPMQLGSGAGGVADEWVTQLLRQGDARVFKKYSQMKLQMKREALEKMNRLANEMSLDAGNSGDPAKEFGTVLVQSTNMLGIEVAVKLESALKSIVHFVSGRSAAW